MNWLEQIQDIRKALLEQARTLYLKAQMVEETEAYWSGYLKGSAERLIEQSDALHDAVMDKMSEELKEVKDVIKILKASGKIGNPNR